MGTMLETIQNAIVQEPQAEAQPGTTQPDDGAIETQLSEEISSLWTEHTRLSADRKATARELRQIRASLAQMLHRMKSLLARPGRGGEWRGWLLERRIPRSTADRLVTRYAETLGGGNGENVPTGAIPSPPEDSAEKLAKSVWQRVGKFLSTGELVVRFIGCIAEISGVRHEQRAEGLVIFNPVPKAAGEATASAPAAGPAPQPPQGGNAIPAETSAAEPAPQPFCETPASVEQPAAEAAATPPAAEQVAAAADAGGSDAA